MSKICGILQVMAILVVCASGGAQAQVCGDANDDESVTIADIVMFIDHIAISGNPVNSSNSDCDGRAGVTIADVHTITRYLFRGIDERDCNPIGDYGFTLSEADTIFLPYMNSIPGDMDSVFLPVITSLAANTEAFYVPLTFGEAGGGDTFWLQRVEEVEWVQMTDGHALPGDSAVVWGSELSAGEEFAGRHQFTQFVFWRSQPGVTSITTAAVERSTLWKPAVYKDGDLYVPVVQYYEVEVPTPTVTVSETDLSFSAIAGSQSYTTHEIEFVTDNRLVSFDLEPSDNWIAFVDLPVGRLTTPVTVEVRLDATELAIGDYFGQIAITNVEPPDAEFNTLAVNVSATVNAPDLYPPGDINCSGIVTIGDISLLIDHLFINQAPLDPCE